MKEGRELHTIHLPLIYMRKWRQWVIDTHARVVVSEFYDVTN